MYGAIIKSMLRILYYVFIITCAGFYVTNKYFQIMDSPSAQHVLNHLPSSLRTRRATREFDFKMDDGSLRRYYAPGVSREEVPGTPYPAEEYGSAQCSLTAITDNSA